MVKRREFICLGFGILGAVAAGDALAACAPAATSALPSASPTPFPPTAPRRTLDGA